MLNTTSKTQAKYNIPQSTFSYLSSWEIKKTRIAFQKLLEEKKSQQDQNINVAQQVSLLLASQLLAQLLAFEKAFRAKRSSILSALEDDEAWIKDWEKLYGVLFLVSGLLYAKNQAEHEAAMAALVSYAEDNLTAQPTGKDIAMGSIAMLASAARILSGQGPDLQRLHWVETTQCTRPTSLTLYFIFWVIF